MMTTILEKMGGSRAHAARLRDFLHDVAGSTACEEADRVREALILLPGGGSDGASGLDYPRIEAMLECGATLNAVLEIVGPDAALMLSRGSNAVCLATVVPAGAPEEAITDGPTLALAVLAGHVSGVVAHLERGDVEPETPEMPAIPLSMRLH
ncbi:hypothetical protein AB3M93_12390 [Novosphingobium panipatense]|jgi:hypothetical protein|uniref:hypothetical protein n=1 Tax=Novosphingobium TaxID=165696 RepID=UPI001E293CF2|nr:hypothetical protein [Novosphingobium sp. HII-3]